MSEKTGFNEYLMDAELGISTIGRNDKYSDTSKYPYEPTDYSVLERLAESGYIDADDFVLDYGCGKGRVPVFLRERLGCRTIGVEVEQDFYEDALGNVNAYFDKSQKDPAGIQLVHAKAQSFEVPDDVTACFFFNPFSVNILKSVIARILESADRNPRRITLLFFYPSDAYVGYLCRIDRGMFEDEIDCTDLFAEDDSRNRIMIYEIDH